MDIFFKAINLVCSGFSFVLIIFAAVKFRKERLFKPLALAFALLLSLVMLPIYFAISGIRLNFFLGFAAFVIGGFFGFLSGRSAKLRRSPLGVMGKQSWLAFLIWGLSLVFSMLVNLAASPVASALGALPLCFTTGIQVSANLNLLFRTRKLGRVQAVGG